MRTFEEVQDGIVYELLNKISSTENRINSGEVDSNAIPPTRDYCKKWKNAIENSEEATKGKIGTCTNDIIKEMQKLCEEDMHSYFQNFDSLISRKLLTLDNFGNCVNPENWNKVFGEERGIGRVSRQVSSLGIEFKDLLCFKGRDPHSAEACDSFKNLVNQNFGTTIPMTGEVKMAKEAYDSIPVTDSYAKAEAFIRMKEMERDEDGYSMTNDLCTILSTNQAYLDAKALCGGRNK